VGSSNQFLKKYLLALFYIVIYIQSNFDMVGKFKQQELSVIASAPIEGACLDGIYPGFFHGMPLKPLQLLASIMVELYTFPHRYLSSLIYAYI
jgi:hypothetical protein